MLTAKHFRVVLLCVRSLITWQNDLKICGIFYMFDLHSTLWYLRHANMVCDAEFQMASFLSSTASLKMAYCYCFGYQYFNFLKCPRHAVFVYYCYLSEVSGNFLLRIIFDFWLLQDSCKGGGWFVFHYLWDTMFSMYFHVMWPAISTDILFVMRCSFLELAFCKCFYQPNE